MAAHAGRDRFLADVGVTGTVNQSALMTAGQLFFRIAE